MATSNHERVGVSESTFDTLWTTALSLADVEEAALRSFPTLGDEVERGPA
jgi:hypothetical protein